MEAAINITTAALVGGNMIHDIGYIEQGLCSSPHMLVASDDIISRTKRVLRGIPVDDDTPALDVLDEVGPGGHFLGHDHTYKRFKTENWRSPLVDRTLEVLLGAPGEDFAAALARATRLHPALAHTLPALAGTTMAPTLLSGSSKRNVMPARASVTVSPSSSSTRRSTPCVEGFWGPMLTTMRSAPSVATSLTISSQSPPPAV